MALFAKLKPGMRPKDGAASELKYGVLYEVEYVSMGQSSTSIRTVSGVYGNSVWFDFYKIPEHDIYSDPEYNPYLELYKKDE